MKSKLIIVILAITSMSNFSKAQDKTTVQATSEKIGDNLDLEAVASVFGDSKDLEDFEKRLNDPDSKINNLDLDEDGNVDYLRVLEDDASSTTHTISVQAVIGKDKYQEVCVLDVEKDSKDSSSVQVVGNVNMYGPNYVIAPVYVHPPVIFTLFWVGFYRPWVSPYYYGYYPPYFRPWRPYPYHYYHSNVHIHVNSYNHYDRPREPRNNKISNRNSHNDYDFSKRGGNSVNINTGNQINVGDNNNIGNKVGDRKPEADKVEGKAGSKAENIKNPSTTPKKPSSVKKPSSTSSRSSVSPSRSTPSHSNVSTPKRTPSKSATSSRAKATKR